MLKFQRLKMCMENGGYELILINVNCVVSIKAMGEGSLLKTLNGDKYMLRESMIDVVKALSCGEDVELNAFNKKTRREIYNN